MKKEVKALKEYFSCRPDISFAFLFGSHAKKRAGRISDWDVAVYFKPEAGHGIQWETAGVEYPQEDKVWNDLIGILKTDDVDLIVLNRIPASIASAAINGLPLATKDRRLFLEFMLIVTGEAEDFRRTAQEYSDIYWRSKSLSGLDRDVINRRLMFLNSELSDAPRFEKLTRLEYEKDTSRRREVERWIENLINASIDIEKTLLAGQRKPVPSSYREILHSSALLPGLSEGHADKLADWAALRNILAHEYLDIRWRRIKDFLDNGSIILKELIKKAREIVEN